MTDPFAALRTPDVPVDPDPEFAARLRARLERALALPKGVDPDVHDDRDPRRCRVITPYLAVADARGAIDWYRSVFGADLVGEPIIMPDGRVGHAELAIGTARLYLSDAHPEIGVVAPQLDAGSSVTLHLETADVDGTTERARTAAATIEREPADSPYGRMSGMRDPFGHRWMLNGPVATTSPVTGDLGYFALWVDDVERADAFYGHVLGWRFTVDDSGRRRVAGHPLPHGAGVTGRDALARMARPHPPDGVLRLPGRRCRRGRGPRPRSRRYRAGRALRRRLLRRPGAGIRDLRRRPRVPRSRGRVPDGRSGRRSTPPRRSTPTCSAGGSGRAASRKDARSRDRVR